MINFQKLFKFLFNLRHQFYKLAGLFLMLMGARQVDFYPLVELLKSDKYFLYSFIALVLFLNPPKSNQRLVQLIGISLVIVTLLKYILFK